MGKTNIKVMSFYDGKKEAKDILVGIISAKLRKIMAESMEESKGKDYNQDIAFYEDYKPGLAEVV